jgi:hypothetical protein
MNQASRQEARSHQPVLLGTVRSMDGILTLSCHMDLFLGSRPLNAATIVLYHLVTLSIGLVVARHLSPYMSAVGKQL